MGGFQVVGPTITVYHRSPWMCHSHLHQWRMTTDTRHVEFVAFLCIFITITFHLVTTMNANFGMFYVCYRPMVALDRVNSCGLGMRRRGYCAALIAPMRGKQCRHGPHGPMGNELPFTCPRARARDEHSHFSHDSSLWQSQPSLPP